MIRKQEWQVPNAERVWLIPETQRGNQYSGSSVAGHQIKLEER